MNRRLCEKNLLPGLDLIVEEHPAALTSSCGLFLARGSMHEELHSAGTTHLAEHLFFKGSTKSSAEDISRRIEGLGGEINAFTDRELTAFYTWLPAGFEKLSLETLFEIVFDCVFDPDEYEKELDVVVQELRGFEESPEDEFWEQVLERAWPNHALGRRVGGWAAEVAHLRYDAVIRYVRKKLLRAPKVLVVAGPVKFETILEDVLALLSKTIENHLWGDLISRSETLSIPDATSEARFVAGMEYSPFDCDQVHLGWVLPAVGWGHKDECAWNALITWAGVGSSSLLYRKLREESGLAYNAASSYICQAKNGLFISSCSTDPSRCVEATETIAHCLYTEVFTLDDFQFMKSLLLGSQTMNSEGVSARMESLGRQKILSAKVTSLSEQRSEIEELQFDDVLRLRKSLSKKALIFALGPLKSSERAALKKIVSC